jgi:hypothetical protein
VRNFLNTKRAGEGLEVRPEVPLEVFANYFAGSLLGILTWWLEKDMPYTPEEMTDMFQKLFFQGARQVLGLLPTTEEE